MGLTSITRWTMLKAGIDPHFKKGFALNVELPQEMRLNNFTLHFSATELEDLLAKVRERSTPPTKAVLPPAPTIAPHEDTRGAFMAPVANTRGRYVDTPVVLTQPRGRDRADQSG